MGFVSDVLHTVLGWLMPTRGSTQAYLVDDLYYGVFIIGIIGFFLLIGTMIFFMVRYHRFNSKESAYIPHNTTAEALWTIIPTIIFVGIAFWGLWAFYKTEQVDKNAMVVKVTGKQWMWEFGYERDGLRVDNPHIMYIPVNTPIRLEMTSIDVLHSFYVPSFRIKRDTVPGARSYLNFTADKVGDFKVFCTEYCGTSHSRMSATVRVLSKKGFEKWLAYGIKEASITDPVELGSRLYSRKGCASCHSTGANRIIGPGFQGLWGREREFQDGSKVVANAEYIRESILMPAKRIVKGYPNKMNSYAGQLSEKEIDYIIEYIKALKE